MGNSKPNTTDSPEGVRTSRRKPKRKKYMDELEDTDSDDLMDSSEEEAAEQRRLKRIAKNKKKKAESEPEPQEDEDDVEDRQEDSGHFALLTQSEIPGSIYDIESAPPGELNHLWYSREPFLHVFVIDKILGWKTRPVTHLEGCGPPSDISEEIERAILSGKPAAGVKGSTNVHKLGYDEAVKLKDKAIFDTGNDFRKRRDISRINPAACPHVKKLASSQEKARSKKEGCEPKFKAVTSTTEREEVLLIKWRGRSYLHCSWERKRAYLVI